MTSFTKRLKYYGIGFGIGLIFVVFFFKNRGCTWLPDNRVKNAILERLIVIPENQEAAFARLEMTEKDILKFLNEGDVAFSESDKSGINKRYKIDLDETSLYFTLPEESFISAVYLKKENRSSELKGRAKVLRFPNEKHLIYVDSTENMSCFIEQKKWQKEGKIQSLMKKSTWIDFDSSNFVKIAKPLHRLVFMDENNEPISLDAIWYKNKINITKFSGADTLQCN
ncbi:MAG: hypothetical protein KJ941_07505 [Bacteroidetes bacterium]|nr:hypothetical protein [Bacteroidota bacterium]